MSSLPGARLPDGSAGFVNGSSAEFARLPRARMTLLFMVMLVTAAGNTAMQSVMPSIGTRLQVPDFAISLAYSWSALLWMVMAPIWARRSDRRGRKAMMALGLWGFSASFLLCGMILAAGLIGWIGGIVTLLLFAAARSLYGLLGSAAPPAVQAYVASRTDPAERTQALSLITSSFGLGTVLGPALAPFLILPGLGLVSPFLWFTLFAMAVLVAVRLALPNDTPRFAARGDIVGEPVSAGSSPRRRDEEPAGEGLGEDAGPPDKLRWRDRRLRPWLVTGLLGAHAQAMVLGVIGFLLLDRLGLRADPDAGAGPIGMVLMTGAAATLLAQWGLIPMLNLGPRAATLLGMALAAVGVALVASSALLHGIAVGFAVASLGFGLMRPGFVAGASLAVNRSEQGQVAGIVAAANGAAYLIAPAGAVWLYNTYPLVAFGVVEAMCLGGIVLGWRGMTRDTGGAPTAN